MFDVVLASAPSTSFAPRVASALRDARMRVATCEVAPHRPPPDALRVDVAVACASSPPVMIDIARSLRAVLDGPPPVVGVSSGTQVSSSRDLADVLPDDLPGPALAARVQRAAALGERRRGRVVLRGELDGVGLGELLGSLASRGKSCFVRVREGNRRAELTLDAGRLAHVRADGLDAGRDRALAVQEIASWRGASFEVVAADDAPPSTPPPREPTRPAPIASGDATDVALAAAVVNACAAYARAWLGPEMAAELLASSYARARSKHPALDAFVVSSDGMVSVAQVGRARSAVPQAIAAWVVGLFEAAGPLNPRRFRRVRLREVLGGLTRLVEQVGWASALMDGELE